MRHTTFRWALDPTVEQEAMLVRHAGARRFAWNQTLALVKAALDARAAGAEVEVPWTGFDLINAFNAWKRSPAAGVTDDGTVGLAWRDQVCQQVFEEAAVDLARALKSFSDGRRGHGPRRGFPTFRKKSRTAPTFRIRNHKNTVRVGVGGVPRSVRLPKIGVVRVREDTRRARRLLRHRDDRQPARIVSATVTRGARRWYVSVTMEAPDLHPAQRHPPRPDGGDGGGGGWVGVDRGLAAFAVVADAHGSEHDRIAAPKPLAAAQRKLRRANRAYHRTRRGSRRRARAAQRLRRVHDKVANQRRHFLHVTSTELVKTHGQLALEDLGVAGMVRNPTLARAISDAAWAAFAQMVGYKTGWRGGQVDVAPRNFASTRRCSACGHVGGPVPLSQRTFVCGACGHVADRDTNAATNLAQRPWRDQHDQRKGWAAAKRAEAENARGEEGAGRHPRGGGGTVLCETGTDRRPAPAGAAPGHPRRVV